MPYKLSRASADDLRQIYVEGIRLFGFKQAANYHARLGQAFETLATYPRLARERQAISPPVRVHPCGSHLIVYIVETNDDVLILRVRHGREDWMNDV